MRVLVVPLFALVLTSIGCAHDEVAAACAQEASCDEALDVGGCISDREANLGELGSRCGDEGTQAALAIYTCQSNLECGEDFSAGCADELAAFEEAREAGGDACAEAPGPLPPGGDDAAS